MTLEQVKNDYGGVHSYYFTLDGDLTWTPGQYVHLIGQYYCLILCPILCPYILLYDLWVGSIHIIYC